MSITQKYGIIPMFLLAIIGVLFYGIGYMPLSADEPIRALIALDMDISNHYLSPELNGDSYLNKPPLYNWILLAIFKLTGNYSEWIIRMPSLIPLLLFIPLIYKVSVTQGMHSRYALITSMAFVTTGNIWFYSSYLGHIDILFSLFTFIQLYLIIQLTAAQKWWQMFAISYFITALGFLMKGLPSIVFQGITLIFCLIQSKQFRKSYSKEHFIGILFFVIPVLAYLFAFSETGNVKNLALKLVSESTSRTVADKSFLESILHLFSFPALLLLDLMPWGLVALVFISKKVRTKILSNSFYKSCLWVFALNILVYWLSPDYRARYVFMLIPFLLIPSFAGLYELRGSIKKYWYWLIAVISILLIPFLIYLYLTYQPKLPEFNVLLTVILCAALLFAAYLANLGRAEREFQNLLFSVFIILFVARVIFTSTIIPMKTANGPYLKEKMEAKEIAKIVGNEPLGMYSSNVSLTMNWYISLARKQMLQTQRSNFDMSSFYLIPTEVIQDPDNVEIFYSFNRRYESKDFSLVKFKKYFPEMLKAQ